MVLGEEEWTLEISDEWAKSREVEIIPKTEEAVVLSLGDYDGNTTFILSCYTPTGDLVWATPITNDSSYLRLGLIVSPNSETIYLLGEMLTLGSVTTAPTVGIYLFSYSASTGAFIKSSLVFGGHSLRQRIYEYDAGKTQLLFHPDYASRLFISCAYTSETTGDQACGAFEFDLIQEQLVWNYAYPLVYSSLTSTYTDGIGYCEISGTLFALVNFYDGSRESWRGALFEYDPDLQSGLNSSSIHIDYDITHFGESMAVHDNYIAIIVSSGIAESSQTMYLQIYDTDLNEITRYNLIPRTYGAVAITDIFIWEHGSRITIVGDSSYTYPLGYYRENLGKQVFIHTFEMNLSRMYLIDVSTYYWGILEYSTDNRDAAFNSDVGMYLAGMTLIFRDHASWDGYLVKFSSLELDPSPESESGGLLTNARQYLTDYWQPLTGGAAVGVLIGGIVVHSLKKK
jgi:hypothetical protein